MSKKLPKLVLVAVDVRSAHNIGSILRTCDGFGAEAFFVGICPLPSHEGDTRLPFIAERAQKAIAKTALGAEKSVRWRYASAFDECVRTLKLEGYKIVAIEQDPASVDIRNISSEGHNALIVGREVEGLSREELALCEVICEISMVGDKESFNVSVVAAIALYQFSN